MPNMVNKDITIRGVPVGLWRRVKMQAARKGWRIKDVVIAALTEYLDPEESDDKP